MKVRRENLSELLEAGQLLNIKGLSNVNHSPAVSKSKPNTSSQLNSRTTIKNNDDPMKVQATSVDVHQEQEPMVNPSNDFMENYDDLKPNGFEINNNNICDGVSNTIPEKGTHGMAGLDKKILHGKRPMSVIHFPRLLSDSIHATKLSKLSNGKWIQLYQYIYASNSMMCYDFVCLQIVNRCTQLRLIFDLMNLGAKTYITRDSNFIDR